MTHNETDHAMHRPSKRTKIRFGIKYSSSRALRYKFKLAKLYICETEIPVNYSNVYHRTPEVHTPSASWWMAPSKWVSFGTDLTAGKYRLKLSTILRTN